jgi:hypothetical protein
MSGSHHQLFAAGQGMIESAITPETPPTSGTLELALAPRIPRQKFIALKNAMNAKNKNRIAPTIHLIQNIAQLRVPLIGGNDDFSTS